MGFLMWNPVCIHSVQMNLNEVKLNKWCFHFDERVKTLPLSNQLSVLDLKEMSFVTIFNTEGEHNLCWWENCEYFSVEHTEKCNVVLCSRIYIYIYI